MGSKSVMRDWHRQTGALLSIGGVLALSAGAFAFAGGWLSPGRLTPDKFVRAFAPEGAALGHRRMHAKGTCFIGTFEATGRGSEFSRAAVFLKGSYPVLGRFNLSTPNPFAADAAVRIRGLGLQIVAADGAVWRSAMVDAPVFPVATPRAFYAMVVASSSKDPDALKRFGAAHPELATFNDWATKAPYMASYAEETFNSLNSFVFVDAAGSRRTVRWSLRPDARPEPMSADDLAKLGPDFLAKEIAERVGKGPQRWTMFVTLAGDGDPTADPSRAWPADRRSVEVGTLIANKVVAESDGPCREINFDPTILPPGIELSDDPFPAARSAVYAKSYDLRTSEESSYPHNGEGQP